MAFLVGRLAAAVGVAVAVLFPVTPAAAAPPSADDIAVTICGNESWDITDWRDTPSFLIDRGGAAHGAGTATRWMYFFDAAHGGWQYIGTQTPWLNGQVNYATGGAFHQGAFRIDGVGWWTPDLPWAGTFVWTDPAVARHTGHGTGTLMLPPDLPASSAWLKSERMEITFGLDATGYPPLPYGGYCLDVAQWRLTRTSAA